MMEWCVTSQPLRQPFKCSETQWPVPGQHVSFVQWATQCPYFQTTAHFGCVYSTTTQGKSTWWSTNLTRHYRKARKDKVLSPCLNFSPRPIYRALLDNEPHSSDPDHKLQMPHPRPITNLGPNPKFLHPAGICLPQMLTTLSQSQI